VIGLFIEARRALTGVLMMLALKPDFRDQFDISAPGVIRSFAAALIAIPIIAFTTASHNLLAAENAGLEPFTVMFQVARFIAQWGYFPLLAVAFTRLIQRPEGLAPWIVFHNWTHLFILAIQMIPMALLITGPTQIVPVLIQLSVLIFVYAYARAAVVSLNVSLPVALGAGAANLMTALLINATLQNVFYPPAG